MAQASHPASPQQESVISIREVTKSYTIWHGSSGRMLALAKRILGISTPHQNVQRFTAVHTLNLEVAPGECLGIIGRNGAGKSTLLQMIAGTLQPSTGHIDVRGRVAALLELGSGFNPDFTGRENVYLNASILGLSKAEIEAQYDSILEYSGIEEFIDQPVRTYSSGMTLRLAFAVCVHVDADILIIDEALAVGDARFQFKCHATLDKMREEGRTIIFVSHDTNSVKRMCQTAILLERGEVLLRGSPNDVSNIYTKLITSPHGVESIRGDLAAMSSNRASEVKTSSNEPTPQGISKNLDSALSDRSAATRLIAEERSHQQISDKEYSYGGESGRITAVELCDHADHARLSFTVGSKIRVRYVCEASSEIADPIYALTIKDVRGQEIFGTNTFFENQVPPPARIGELVEIVFDIQLNVQPGVFFISLGWVRLVNGEVQVIHRRYDVLRFDVLPRDKSFGLVWCPTNIQVNSLTANQ